LIALRITVLHRNNPLRQAASEILSLGQAAACSLNSQRDKEIKILRAKALLISQRSLKPDE